METQLDLDHSIIQFSKHFLVKGWGPTQQDQANTLRIHFPQEWTLFKSYLKAMGNQIDTSTTLVQYDLSCFVEIEQTTLDRCQNILSSKCLGQSLEIQLQQDLKILKKWSFFSPSPTPSKELVQLSFFLCVTDSIKLRLIAQ